jgi:hypothetical protein
VLPEETFGKYENLIRVTLYEQMKKEVFGGEDPRQALRRAEIQQETQIQTRVYTQLSDGQVPSLEQFTSMKKQLDKKPLSPLQEQEKK